MNYKDDDNQKIPFYMTYPMQNMYLTEMEYEKDMERMKELYPREVRTLQELIERRCDELEQDGSRMYDENPDRRMLEEEVCRLYKRFLHENPQYNVMMPPPMSPPPSRPMEPQPIPPRPSRPMEPQPMPPRPSRPMEPRPIPSRPGRPMEPQPMPPRPDMPVPRPMPREEIQMQEYGTISERGWLSSLIHIMFYNEIYRRRCRNRRCRRWW